ncbi:hypothetical protein J6590_055152 [Homalodisca vitripennis]|nr:hypothetical protein J6590_055152 [Homalodisca vitripennis]
MEYNQQQWIVLGVNLHAWSCLITDSPDSKVDTTHRHHTIPIHIRFRLLLIPPARLSNPRPPKRKLSYGRVKDPGLWVRRPVCRRLCHLGPVVDLIPASLIHTFHSWLCSCCWFRPPTLATSSSCEPVIWITLIPTSFFTVPRNEEWNTEPTKESLFLVQPGQGSWRSSGEMSLPRARRLNSSGFDPPTPVPDGELVSRRRRVNSSNCADYYRSREPAEEPSIYPDMTKLKKQHSADSFSQPGSNTHQPVAQRRRKNAEERQRSPSPTNTKSTIGSLTPRDRFNDAKEKFLSLEREKQEERERQERALINERRRNNQPIEPPISPSVMPVMRLRRMNSWSRSKDSEEEVEELSQHGYSANDDNYKYHNEREYVHGLRREPSYLKSHSHGSIPDSEDNSMMQHGKPSLPYVHRSEEQRRKVNPSPSTRNIDSHGYNTPEDKFNPPINRRYASPRREHSPAMKNRKERCKSPVGNIPRSSPMKYPDDPPIEDTHSRYVGKIPRSHLNMNPVPFAENNSAIPLERYRSPPRVSTAPRPSPRHQRYPTPNSEDEDDHDYRNVMHSDMRNYPQRVYDNNDKKRRSMYESIEDERRRNSNELAKEFKRRSFQDHGPTMEICANSLDYQELDERERYPGLDRETARVHPADEVQTSSPRYRHSYAEPFHQYQPTLQPHHEMLHHTNSSLSSGRVGMAAIHPY